MAFYRQLTNSVAGSRLKAATERLHDAVTEYVREFRTMEQMLTGDGSNDTHYNVIAAEYGFVDASAVESTSVAHGAYGVISAAALKLDTNNSVSDVKGAIATATTNVGR
jgi:hypothetical protein